MKMMVQRRALDKVYKRRDRYEIPDWQRGEVWDIAKKQQLIDSILRGWRLPKFYFVKNAEDQYDVVDGQQRLTAIYEFFANELPLDGAASAQFGGPYYKDLSPKFSDAFDDFEIEFDEIQEASETDLKNFFQRLQQGLPLTSSERLNSVHSKLRDFCKAQAKHDFMKKSIAVNDTRYAHFDILSKALAIEVEGVETGLRYDDVKAIFDSQSNFSPASAVAKRVKAALDFLHKAFPAKSALLRNRTIVQSAISLACRLVSTNKSAGLEGKFASFVQAFTKELAHQVELGQAATDYDFIRFQKSINANIKTGARTRQEILLRKAFLHDPALAAAFDSTTLSQIGLPGRIIDLAEGIQTEISRLNNSYAAMHGEDLFKATNKTVTALTRLRKPIKTASQYETFISDLYFLFREAAGQRLDGQLPLSFVDVNILRTELQHDTDHGKNKDVKAKKKTAGEVFRKYSGEVSPDVLDPAKFILVQANLLSALELDLKNLSIPKAGV